MNNLTEKELELLSTGRYTVDELLIIIEKGIIFSKYSYDNDKLKKFIISLDANKYREIINALSFNNFKLANIIEKERYEYVKKAVESIDENDIFINLYSKTKDELSLMLPKDSMKKVVFELNRGNNINSILKTYTKKCLCEYVIDLYFKDIAFNMLYNIKTMLNYLSKINDNIIPKERLVFYRQILNFDKISMEEKKELFYNYDFNKRYIDEFYDDFSKCKMHSYQNINDCIIKNNKLDNIYSKELSNKYGINIYELNGEDFYLYSHTSKIDINNLEFPYKKSNKNRTLSISLIGKDNITTYDPPVEYIILGFEYLEPSNIIHLFNSDSYTRNLNSTTKFQRIYKAEDLLKNSYGYNEILYKKTPMDNLYPSYIICFDEIRPIDLFFSKLEELPIIKINTNKYRKTGSIEDRLENNYLDSKKAKEIEFYSIYF